MSESAIHLPRGLVNQLLRHAQSAPATETCGIVAARDGVPTTFYPIPNTASDPSRQYLIDPQAHIAALRHMRDEGSELFAIVHSHPAAPAEPSRIDLEQANIPDAFHLIVSLNTKGVLELRGFRIDREHRASEVELLLAPEP